MKKLILAAAVLCSLTAQTARWSTEISVSEAGKLESTALNTLVSEFRVVEEDISIDVYIDMWETTAKLLYKKTEEPLRNSVKQLHHINASQWYCDVEVESDSVMTRKITMKKASHLVKDLFFMLYEMNIAHKEEALKSYTPKLYKVLKENKLSYMMSSIYCGDEYAYSSILSVFDEETSELVNIKVGYSD